MWLLQESEYGWDAGLRQGWQEGSFGRTLDAQTGKTVGALKEF